MTACDPQRPLKNSAEHDAFRKKLTVKPDHKFEILVNGARWKMERPILDTCEIDKRVVVIFDYMSYPKSGQAKNMVAFDMEQKELWTAEHPTTQTNDAYVKFTGGDPLRAWNFACYHCTLDPATGKLLAAEFTK